MSRVIEKTLPEGWLETTIENSCEILDKLRKPISQKNRTNGEYPYYGATGIVDYINNYIFDERLVLVGEDGAKWERGDKTGFIAEGKYWVNNHAHVLRVNEDILIDKWLVNFLCFSDLSDYITGTTVPKLNQAKLKSIEFPLPPLEEQKRIVAKIDTLFAKIDKAISLTEESLKQAKNLLPSVLKEVFEKGKADGWEEKKLVEIAFLKSGSTPRRSNKSYWEGGTIPWLKSGELNDSMEIKENSEFITEIALDETSVKLFKKDTLLIAMYGATAGKLGILSFDATTNQAVCSIQNKKEIFNNHFMFYFLLSIREKIISDSFGGAQPNISKTYLENLSLYIPDLSTQDEVASLCDELSKKSKQTQSKLKEQLAYLKQLKSSILIKAFKGEL